MDWGNLAQQQDGVVSRRQLVELGLADHDVRRLVRRRDLTRVHLGVYVTHTGELSWRQRAWAAVLYFHPAALWGPSALVLQRSPPGAPPGPLHVAVDEERRVGGLTGVVVHRVSGLRNQARLHASPPRMRAEYAVLDAASVAAGEFERVAVLTDAVQARVVTVDRLRSALDERSKLRGRRLVAALLDDLEGGADSVLEHGYLTRVERAHGLPRGRRQASVPGLRARHDVVYEMARTVVELDGRAYHSLASQRYADLERDAAAAAAGHLTIRLGWGQVFSSPCTTAERLATVLRQRGWAGSLRRCPQCP